MAPFLLALPSLAKRLQEDAERCLAEMEAYQARQERRAATKGCGAE
jgi:hypothetical protein